MQDTAFDTQQAIDELKDMLNAPCKDRPAPPPMPGPAPDGGLEKAIAELKAKLEKQEKTTLICTIAACVAAVAAVIGWFI